MTNKNKSFIYKAVEQVGYAQSEMIDSMVKENLPKWQLFLLVKLRHHIWIDLFGWEVVIKRNQIGLDCEAVLMHRNKQVDRRYLRIKYPEGL